MSENQKSAVALSETVQIPWNRLRLSKNNVRAVKPDNNADKALVANIAQMGVLENLIVSPSNDEDGCFQVHAGGRRFSAIGLNVKAGVFEESYLVPCRIQESGNHTAVSLAENLQAPMHPADEFAAFKRMLDEGLGCDDVAQHFGVTAQRVSQRLKLAQVASQILSAYRRGEINLDAVMAFTLSDSKSRQIEVFKALKGYCFAHNVREAFAGASMRSDDRLARFVGEKAYVNAGGTVLDDMFSDFNYFEDGELVRTLAIESLQQEAKELTEKEGWVTVKVELENFGYRQGFVRVNPELVGDHSELSAKLDAVVEEQAGMDEFDENWTEEDEERFESLADEINALESELDAFRVYTDEHKNKGMCVVSISHDGKLEIERGWMPSQSLRAKKVKEGADGKPTISMALRDDLGLHRQQIAKACLLDEPELANDLLLYSLCYPLLSECRWDSRALDARFERVMPDNRHEHSESKAGVRGGPGGFQLHLCRGHLDSGSNRLATQPCAGLRVLRRGAGTGHPG